MQLRSTRITGVRIGVIWCPHVVELILQQGLFLLVAQGLTEAICQHSGHIPSRCPLRIELKILVLEAKIETGSIFRVVRLPQGLGVIIVVYDASASAL